VATDSQTEVVNQTPNTYLHLFISLVRHKHPRTPLGVLAWENAPLQPSLSTYKLY
jgi:hypothetical protein